jgi:7,8-dihydropterin-6-yl-methyl-4-(beta-D-ribofuranosyl)aminobenzene 5'-phosphate synthase
MGLDPGSADCVVLSHGHYDHCGGLPSLSGARMPPRIYAHEGAFDKKYALNADGVTLRDIGIPWSPDSCTDIKNRLVLTKGKTLIAYGVYVCGDIPFTVPFENKPEGFFTGDGAERKPDTMRDEQMLVFDTEKGLCVFLGCSHPE